MDIRVLLEERDAAIGSGDPEELRQFIVKYGGEEPPDGVDWPLVVASTKKSITTFPEFDPGFNYDSLPEREMAVVGDILIPHDGLVWAISQGEQV